MEKRRSELHREVVEALISTKAVNFEAAGSVLAKYGARAALSGEGLGAIINWRVIDICIPVEHLLSQGELVHSIAAGTKG